MRVIAGKAKHLPLKALPGLTTRPTTDRIKETLFNMIQNDIPDCRFLDLFSGSGAIGIEALSRGAQMAVFVEQNRDAASVIRENLKFTHLEKDSQLLVMDVRQSLGRLQNEKPFDIIFMDPPYRQDLEKEVLEYLSDKPCVDSYTLIIIEAALDTTFDYLDSLGYEMVKYKKYKTNAHIFIRKKEEA